MRNAHLKKVKFINSGNENKPLAILGKSSFSPSNSDEGVNIWAKTFFLLPVLQRWYRTYFKNR